MAEPSVFLQQQAAKEAEKISQKFGPGVYGSAEYRLLKDVFARANEGAASSADAAAAAVPTTPTGISSNTGRQSPTGIEANKTTATVDAAAAVPSVDTSRNKTTWEEKSKLQKAGETVQAAGANVASGLAEKIQTLANPYTWGTSVTNFLASGKQNKIDRTEAIMGKMAEKGMISAEQAREAAERVNAERKQDVRELSQKTSELEKKAQALDNKDNLINKFAKKTSQIAEREMSDLGGEVAPWLASLGTSIGSLLPDIAIGKAAGAVTNLAATALGGGAAAPAVVQNVAATAGLGSMFNGVYGQTYNALRDEGVDQLAASQNAFGKATIEVGTEILGGGIPMLSEGIFEGVLRKGATRMASLMPIKTIETLTQAAASTPGIASGLAKVALGFGKMLTSEPVTDLLVEMAGEAGEEALSEFLSPFVDRATIDPNAPMATAEEMLQAAAGGALIGGFFDVSQSMLNKARTGKLRVFDNINGEKTTVLENQFGFSKAMVSKGSSYEFIYKDPSGNTISKEAYDAAMAAGKAAMAPETNPAVIDAAAGETVAPVAPETATAEAQPVAVDPVMAAVQAAEAAVVEYRGVTPSVQTAEAEQASGRQSSSGMFTDADVSTKADYITAVNAMLFDTVQSITYDYGMEAIAELGIPAIELDLPPLNENMSWAEIEEALNDIKAKAQEAINLKARRVVASNAARALYANKVFDIQVTPAMINAATVEAFMQNNPGMQEAEARQQLADNFNNTKWESPEAREKAWKEQIDSVGVYRYFLENGEAEARYGTEMLTGLKEHILLNNLSDTQRAEALGKLTTKVAEYNKVLSKFGLKADIMPTEMANEYKTWAAAVSGDTIYFNPNLIHSTYTMGVCLGHELWHISQDNGAALAFNNDIARMAESMGISYKDLYDVVDKAYPQLKGNPDLINREVTARFVGNMLASSDFLAEVAKANVQSVMGIQRFIESQASAGTMSEQYAQLLGNIAYAINGIKQRKAVTPTGTVLAKSLPQKAQTGVPLIDNNIAFVYTKLSRGGVIEAHLTSDAQGKTKTDILKKAKAELESLGAECKLKKGMLTIKSKAWESILHLPSLDTVLIQPELKEAPKKAAQVPTPIESKTEQIIIGETASPASVAEEVIQPAAEAAIEEAAPAMLDEVAEPTVEEVEAEEILEEPEQIETGDPLVDNGFVQIPASTIEAKEQVEMERKDSLLTKPANLIDTTGKGKLNGFKMRFDFNKNRIELVKPHNKLTEPEKNALRKIGFRSLGTWLDASGNEVGVPGMWVYTGKKGDGAQQKWIELGGFELTEEVKSSATLRKSGEGAKTVSKEERMRRMREENARNSVQTWDFPGIDDALMTNSLITDTRGDHSALVVRKFGDFTAEDEMMLRKLGFNPEVLESRDIADLDEWERENRISEGDVSSEDEQSNKQQIISGVATGPRLVYVFRYGGPRTNTRSDTANDIMSAVAAGNVEALIGTQAPVYAPYEVKGPVPGRLYYVEAENELRFKPFRAHTAGEREANSSYIRLQEGFNYDPLLQMYVAPYSAEQFASMIGQNLSLEELQENNKKYLESETNEAIFENVSKESSVKWKKAGAGSKFAGSYYTIRDGQILLRTPDKAIYTAPYSDTLKASLQGTRAGNQAAARSSRLQREALDIVNEEFARAAAEDDNAFGLTPEELDNWNKEFFANRWSEKYVGNRAKSQGIRNIDGVQQLLKSRYGNGETDFAKLSYEFTKTRLQEISKALKNDATVKHDYYTRHDSGGTLIVEIPLADADAVLFLQNLGFEIVKRSDSDVLTLTAPWSTETSMAVGETLERELTPEQIVTLANVKDRAGKAHRRVLKEWNQSLAKLAETGTPHSEVKRYILSPEELIQWRIKNGIISAESLMGVEERQERQARIEESRAKKQAEIAEKIAANREALRVAREARKAAEAAEDIIPPAPKEAQAAEETKSDILDEVFAEKVIEAEPDVQLMDTEGKVIPPEQAVYFENGIVNSEGQLEVLYYQAQNAKTNGVRVRNGAEGRGVYLKVGKAPAVPGNTLKFYGTAANVFDATSTSGLLVRDVPVNVLTQVVESIAKTHRRGGAAAEVMNSLGLPDSSILEQVMSIPDDAQRNIVLSRFNLNADLMYVINQISTQLYKSNPSLMTAEIVRALGFDAVRTDGYIVVFDESQLQDVDNTDPSELTGGISGFAVETSEDYTDQRYAELQDRYDTYEKNGEDTGVPKRSDSVHKVSRITIQLDEHLGENLARDPRQQAALREAVIEGRLSFDPITNAERAEQGRNWIGRFRHNTASGVSAIDFIAAYEAFAKEVDNAKLKDSDAVVTKGLQLYTEIRNALAVSNSNELLTMAVQVWSRLQLMATAHAQSLQNYSNLKNMVPAGRLYLLGMTTLKLAEDIQNRKGLLDQVKNAKQYIEALQDYEIPAELQNALLTATSAEAQAAIEDVIIQQIAELIPPTVRTRLHAWRYLCMLGNVRTHLRNIFSNSAMQVGRDISRFMSGYAEDVFMKNAEAGTRTNTAAKPDADQLAFAAKDAKQQLSLLQAGGKAGNDVNFIERVNQYARKFGKTRLGKTIDWLSKGNSNLLEYEDGLYLELTYKKAMSKIMKANGWSAEYFENAVNADGTVNSRQALEDLTTARAYATEQALEATYRSANALATALNKATKADGLGGAAAAFFIEGLAPFKRTPFNIFKTGVQYSPLGLIDGMHRLVKAANGGSQSLSEAISRTCDGLTGTAATLLGLWTGWLGFAKAKGSDDDRREYYEQMTGIQPYSINFFDLATVTADWLTPSSMPFFAGVGLGNSLVEMQANSEDGETPEITFEMVSKALMSMADPLLSLTMLSSLNTALEGYSYKGASSIVSAAAESLPLQMVPTVSGQLIRTFDTTRTTTYAAKDSEGFFGQSGAKFLNKLRNKSITARLIMGSNEPYIDQWGRTEERAGGLGTAFNQMANPSYVKATNRTAVDDQLAQVYAETKDSHVLPSTPNSYFQINGQKYYMSPSEYTELKETVGSLSYEGINTAFASNLFSELDTDAKVKVIYDGIYDYAKDKGKYDYAVAHGIQYEVPKNIEKVAEAQRLGLSIGEYFIINYNMSQLKKKADKTQYAATLGLNFNQRQLFF